ncbi:MAG: NOB1 family endonuclease [Nitrososphaerales archaeon]
MQNSVSSVILDASAFYAGIPFLGSSKCYTTGSILNEIKHIKKAFSVIEALIDAGNVVIKEPEKKYIGIAREIARRSGDLVNMSDADLSVIALALEMRDANPMIVTDDYAIANVAKLSNIKISYVMSKGISKVGRWIRYCTACGICYTKNEKVCEICGNRLRARLKGVQKQ